MAPRGTIADKQPIFCDAAILPLLQGSQQAPLDFLFLHAHLHFYPTTQWVVKAEKVGGHHAF